MKYLLLLLTVCLAACTKITIEERPTEGDVNLSMDWTEQVAPAGMRFYFYPMSTATRAEENAPLVREVSASGFVGTLPVGSYRVLAVNTDASGLELIDTNRFETATGVMKSLGAPCGSLYTWKMDSLLVRYDTGVKETGAASSLTRMLSFRFSLEGAGLRSLTGAVCGFYPSVLLATGAPSAASAAAAPTTEAAFNVALNGDKGYAELHTLGVLPPRNGVAYQHLLRLTATTLGGKEQELNVDLSNTITDILSENGGSLPVDVPVEVLLEVAAGNQVELTARVTGWQPATGKGEIIE